MVSQIIEKKSDKLFQFCHPVRQHGTQVNLLIWRKKKINPGSQMQVLKQVQDDKRKKAFISPGQQTRDNTDRSLFRSSSDLVKNFLFDFVFQVRYINETYRLALRAVVYR